MKSDNKCTKLKGKIIIYVHFILFEGIGKKFPFSSILDFAILSDFSEEDCNYLRGGGGVRGGGLFG